MLRQRLILTVLAIVLIYLPPIYGQLEFEYHSIDSIDANSVYAEDIDGDDDIDILTAFDNSITLFENDGNLNFMAYTISDSAVDVQSVYAMDFDCDGDMDVISVSSSKIVWHENDGIHNFIAHTIFSIYSGHGSGLCSACVKDVDSDEDMDVVISTDYQIAWLINDDNQNFIYDTIDVIGRFRYSNVLVADINRDGYQDVIASIGGGLTVIGPPEIVWYENDGSQAFTIHAVSDSIAEMPIYVEDVDGDGDMDVLVASNNKVGWYENDRNGNFTFHLVQEDGWWGNFTSIYAKDIDSDNDMDIFSGTHYFGFGNSYYVTFFENDGNQNFTVHGLYYGRGPITSVYAEDIDNDDDMDLMSAHALIPAEPMTNEIPGGIVLYENLMITDIYEPELKEKLQEFQLLQNYPNPFNPKTVISYQLPVSSEVELSIYNLLGQKVATLVSKKQPAGYYQAEWNAANFASGIYLYRLCANDFTKVKKLLLLK